MIESAVWLGVFQVKMFECQKRKELGCSSSAEVRKIH